MPERESKEALQSSPHGGALAEIVRVALRARMGKRMIPCRVPVIRGRLFELVGSTIQSLASWITLVRQRPWSTAALVWTIQPTDYQKKRNVECLILEQIAHNANSFSELNASRKQQLRICNLDDTGMKNKRATKGRPSMRFSDPAPRVCYMNALKPARAIRNPNRIKMPNMIRKLKIEWHKSPNHSSFNVHKFLLGCFHERGRSEWQRRWFLSSANRPRS
jgi:hypothetical protein